MGPPVRIFSVLLPVVPPQCAKPRSQAIMATKNIKNAFALQFSVDSKKCDDKWIQMAQTQLCICTHKWFYRILPENWILDLLKAMLATNSCLALCPKGHVKSWSFMIFLWHADSSFFLISRGLDILTVNKCHTIGCRKLQRYSDL